MSTSSVAAPRILVVEDQAIVAEDLVSRLRRLGYEIVGTARTAAESLQQVRDESPDLVLMDVRLDGGVDGIDAAADIRTQIGVPVVYVTAHGDSATFSRAKDTAPFGYVLKPFDERQLQMAIELALRQQETQNQLEQARRWLAATLSSIGDGVVATSPSGRVVFINREAERILGVVEPKVRGRNVVEVFHRASADDAQSLAAVAGAVLQDAVNGGRTVKVPVALDLDGMHIEGNVTPIFDGHQTVSGCIVVFRDVTSQRRIEAEKEKLIRELQAALSEVDVLRGMLPICAWCRRIRNDEGYWHSLEEFLVNYSEVKTTHGICPECADKMRKEFEGDVRA